jgi:hypothetical protein
MKKISEKINIFSMRNKFCKIVQEIEKALGALGVRLG